jgi:uncharacterized membrane protein
MLPDPLHPAMVHFPIVLAVLLPIAVLGAHFAISRGAPLRRTWAIPVGLAALLMASSIVSVETGQAQEDRVERAVPERAIHVHEERAERFLVLSGALLVVLVGGLAGGTIGASSRVVGAVGAVLLLLPAAQVGASGGELVYEYGAAQVYVDGSAGQRASPATQGETDDHDDDRGR